MENLQIEDVYMKINTYISESKDVVEIESLLEKEFFYSFKHLDELFVENYKTTINNFVKKRKLMDAYDNWISNGSLPIHNNSTISGIKRFKLKFKTAFGFTPEEAQENDIDLHIFLPDSELFRRLKNAPYITNYKIINNSAKQIIDPTQLMLISLSMPTYIIPKEVWERSISMNNSDDFDKKIVLLILSDLNNSYETKRYTLEELVNKAESLELYNIDSPYEINGMLYFTFRIKDEYFGIFEHKINDILPRLVLCSNNQSIFSDPFLKAFYEWKRSNTPIPLVEDYIEDFAKTCSFDAKNTTSKLWKMAKAGIIRYLPI